MLVYNVPFLRRPLIINITLPVGGGLLWDTATADETTGSPTSATADEPFEFTLSANAANCVCTVSPDDAIAGRNGNNWGI